MEGAARVSLPGPSERRNLQRPSPFHIIILTNQPPEKLYQRFEGLSLDKPPIPGSISMVPTDSFAEWIWEGTKDSLHVFMEQSQANEARFYVSMSRPCSCMHIFTDSKVALRDAVTSRDGQDRAWTAATR